MLDKYSFTTRTRNPVSEYRLIARGLTTRISMNIRSLPIETPFVYVFGKSDGIYYAGRLLDSVCDVGILHLDLKSNICVY